MEVNAIRGDGEPYLSATALVASVRRPKLRQLENKATAMSALQRIRPLAAIIVTISIARSVPCEAQPANPDRGHALALRLCTQCHAVERGGTGPTMADVPSFAAIAARPTTTAEHLAGRIMIPHPEMPGVSLTRQELRDVIGYILDLK
jgi:mono/diheme cytochrome c family protein